jgi:hypothetical protein
MPLARVPVIRFLRVVALTASAAVAVTSAQAAGPQLTATAYRAKANAICADLNRYQIPVTDTFVHGMMGALKKTEASVTALSRLQPPSSLAPLHLKMLKVETQFVDYFGVLIAKVQAGTLTPAKMIAQLARSPLGREGAALWQKLGASICAQS